MLARDLGCPNVNAMLAQMGSTQLAEWAAFYAIEAEDERRANLQAIANAKVSQLR